MHKALLKSARLFLCRVGRVVGCYHLDSAIAYSLDKSHSVFLRADRRVHLEARVFLEHHIIHGKVVRSSLAAYVKTALLSLSYKLNAFLCGNVADVI